MSSGNEETGQPKGNRGLMLLAQLKKVEKDSDVTSLAVEELSEKEVNAKTKRHEYTLEQMRKLAEKVLQGNGDLSCPAVLEEYYSKIKETGVANCVPRKSALNFATHYHQQTSEESRVRGGDEKKMDKNSSKSGSKGGEFIRGKKVEGDDAPAPPTTSRFGVKHASASAHNNNSYNNKDSKTRNDRDGNFRDRRNNEEEDRPRKRYDDKWDSVEPMDAIKAIADARAEEEGAIAEEKPKPTAPKSSKQEKFEEERRLFEEYRLKLQSDRKNKETPVKQSTAKTDEAVEADLHKRSSIGEEDEEVVKGYHDETDALMEELLEEQRQFEKKKADTGTAKLAASSSGAPLESIVSKPLDSLAIEQLTGSLLDTLFGMPAASTSAGAPSGSSRLNQWSSAGNTAPTQSGTVGTNEAKIMDALGSVLADPHAHGLRGASGNAPAAAAPHPPPGMTRIPHHPQPGATKQQVPPQQQYQQQQGHANEPKSHQHLLLQLQQQQQQLLQQQQQLQRQQQQQQQSAAASNQAKVTKLDVAKLLNLQQQQAAARPNMPQPPASGAGVVPPHPAHGGGAPQMNPAANQQQMMEMQRQQFMMQHMKNLQQQQAQIAKNQHQHQQMQSQQETIQTLLKQQQQHAAAQSAMGGNARNTVDLLSRLGINASVAPGAGSAGTHMTPVKPTQHQQQFSAGGSTGGSDSSKSPFSFHNNVGPANSRPAGGIVGSVNTASASAAGASGHPTGQQVVGLQASPFDAAKQLQRLKVLQAQ